MGAALKHVLDIFNYRATWPVLKPWLVLVSSNFDAFFENMKNNGNQRFKMIVVSNVCKIIPYEPSSLKSVIFHS